MKKKVRSARKPSNITIKYKDLEPYCNGNDITSESILATLKLSKDINNKFESAGIKYDNQLLLDVIDQYILAVKK